MLAVFCHKCFECGCRFENLAMFGFSVVFCQIDMALAGLYRVWRLLIEQFGSFDWERAQFAPWRCWERSWRSSRRSCSSSQRSHWVYFESAVSSILAWHSSALSLLHSHWKSCPGLLTVILMHHLGSAVLFPDCCFWENAPNLRLFYVQSVFKLPPDCYVNSLLALFGPFWLELVHSVVEKATKLELQQEWELLP